MDQVLLHAFRHGKWAYGGKNVAYRSINRPTASELGNRCFAGAGAGAFCVILDQSVVHAKRNKRARIMDNDDNPEEDCRFLLPSFTLSHGRYGERQLLYACTLTIAHLFCRHILLSPRFLSLSISMSGVADRSHPPILLASCALHGHRALYFSRHKNQFGREWVVRGVWGHHAKIQGRKQTNK